MRSLPSAALRPPKLTLTDFLDFTIATPTGRLSKVRAVKYRPD